MPRINWQIQIKDILTVGAVLLTAGGLIANSSAGFSQLRMEMEAVKQIIQRLSDRYDRDHEEVVRHGMRIDSLEKDQVRQDRDITGGK